MTAISVGTGVGRRPASPWLWVWIAAAAVTALLALSGIPWLDDYPKGLEVSLAKWVSAIMRWVISTVFDVTRAISAVLELPVDFALNLLSENFKIGQGKEALVLPRLSWVGVTAAAAIIGHVYGGWRLATLSGLCFLYLAVFGQ